MLYIHMSVRLILSIVILIFFSIFFVHIFMFFFFFFFSSRRRHTRLQGDWSSDVCSSDLFRAISSSSKSVVVVPSATFPQRGVIPAVKSNDDTSCVFPVPPWPTMPTFLMSLVRYVFIQTSQSAPLVACRRGPSCQWQARACAWVS